MIKKRALTHNSLILVKWVCHLFVLIDLINHLNHFLHLFTRFIDLWSLYQRDCLPDSDLKRLNSELSTLSSLYDPTYFVFIHKLYESFRVTAL